MWDIWANLLLPKAFKSCPKSKKSPNQVTLVVGESSTKCAKATKKILSSF